MRFFQSVAVITGTCLTVGFSGLPALAQDPPANVTVEEQVQQDLDEQPASAEVYIDEILGITDEQAAQIREIFARYEAPIEAARANYLVSLNRLDALLVPETPSAAISDAYAETTANEQALYNLLLERNLAIRDVLTFEQRSQINTYVRALLDLVATEIATPAVEFPENLVGLDLEEAIALLEDDGWVFATEVAGTAYFDKDGQQLELDVDSNNQVQAVFLQ